MFIDVEFGLETESCFVDRVGFIDNEFVSEKESLIDATWLSIYKLSA